MKDGRLKDGIESINDRIDHLAERVSPDMRAVFFHSERRDLTITRYFPFFILACLVLWVVVMMYLGDYSFPKLLENLCLVFVVMFALIGTMFFRMLNAGTFPRWSLLIGSLAISSLIWLSEIRFGDMVYAEAVDAVLSVLHMDLSDDMVVVLGFLVLFYITLFTTVGVLSVTSAYLRIYLARVFATMDSHAVDGIRGKAESFFMVPDIIDPKEVVIEPKINVHRFNFRVFLRMFLYTLVLGMMISSYLFINPLFLDVMSWKTMLSIMLMLSMFVPVLVVPWQLVEDLGAKVRSDAPRDYYLYVGAKKRLFSTFAALGVFMMMFVLSLYFGNDVLDILKNYLYYLIPLVFTSAMYAFIYSNNFHEAMKLTIQARFEDYKGSYRKR
ncbi:MAG: hypothetical protein IJ469_05670 [Candidatus Methanomethylophilaceae archaeon]|nr:hypothetical protein [Candidatus Methanomethylophilaceae archaeon]